MRVQDCISKMSKMYLARIVDSIIKEAIPKGDEERMREQINQNKEELINPARIEKALDLSTLSRSNRILIEAILTNLLEYDDYHCNDDELFQNIKDYETSIITQSNTDEAYEFSDDDALEIYESVLKIALNDNNINEREYLILDTLREKLSISRFEHRLLEAKLNMYPKPDNQPHDLNEFKQALRELQNIGIVFYCNKDNNKVVLPEEILPTIKSILGFELKTESFKLLLSKFNTGQISNLLREQKLPIAGNKEEKADRVISAGIKPSEALKTLTTNDLIAICRKLKGVKIGGTKNEKVERIINYFANLSSKKASLSEDDREIYFQYYEELAKRKNSDLYNLGIITKDKEMEVLFEEATRYIFEVILGLKLNSFEGTDNPDGAVDMNGNEVLYWDNKSKESEYKFPKTHYKQFKRYIRESIKRVNIFLIIVPEVDKEADNSARKLKFETSSDSDIAIITARDLKYIAEYWQSLPQKDKKAFNPKVFNHTGILDRKTLEQNLKLITS